MCPRTYFSPVYLVYYSPVLFIIMGGGGSSSPHMVNTETHWKMENIIGKSGACSCWGCKVKERTCNNNPREPENQFLDTGSMDHSHIHYRCLGVGTRTSPTCWLLMFILFSLPGRSPQRHMLWEVGVLNAVVMGNWVLLLHKIPGGRAVLKKNISQ